MCWPCAAYGFLFMCLLFSCNVLLHVSIEVVSGQWRTMFMGHNFHYFTLPLLTLLRGKRYDYYSHPDLMLCTQSNGIV